MSLTPDFAADAKSQWRELAPEYQEIVLDILDRLAANPPANGEHVAEDVREDHALRQYIFVHVLVEREFSRLTVMGVGQTTRPID